MEGIGRRIRIQDWTQAKTQDTIFKILKAKRAGGRGAFKW
jgi:hypothetical protein